jgi:UPF0755 protein
VKVALVSAAAAVLAWGGFSLFAPVSDSRRPVIVRIPRGATVAQVGGTLQDRGLVRTKWAFILLARLLGESGHLKPGEYSLQPSMRPIVILDRMVRGEIIAQMITVPEGFTVAQIAERLRARGAIDDTRDFLRLAHAGYGGLVNGFPMPHGGLEGFLFPDTYEVRRGVDERDLLRDMLDNFRRKAWGPLSAGVKASGYSLPQIVTVASLIEREARVPKDRPLIAAVIYNRLRARMRLQIDATVMYALGGHKERVTFADLAVPSPYNTYRVSGLPPGPICNPGLSALSAAVTPAKVGYLYYVAMPDGTHLFGHSLEEHSQNIRRARAARRAPG